jgi:hypothetical protein
MFSASFVKEASVHPDFVAKMDKLTTQLADKHQVSKQLVNFFIQGTLLRTKLAVLGATVVDKKGRIDVRDSCEKIVVEIMNLTHLAAGLEIKEEKVDSAQPLTVGKVPPQVRIVNLAQDVEGEMQPLINFYYYGIDDSDKQLRGKPS